MRSLLARSIFALSVLLLGGCGGGGGGGGGDFDSSADVSISDDPSSIDVGDFTEVTVNISNVNTNGIALKIRYPDALKYFAGTSFLNVDGTDLDVSPTVDDFKGDVRYLVYYLSRDIFGDSNQGVLRFQLKAIQGVDGGLVEVDPDVDDPSIPNNIEFNINSPEFEADDSVDISVEK